MSKDIWPGIGLSAVPFDWRKFMDVPSSAKSTAAVERKRKEGTDTSTIVGLSRKDRRSTAPALMRGPEPGYGMREDSAAGRARVFLMSGPKTRMEIAKEIGVKYSNVNGMLGNDIRQGRVIVLRDTSPIRFALPEVGNA